MATNKKAIVTIDTMKVKESSLPFVFLCLLNVGSVYTSFSKRDIAKADDNFNALVKTFLRKNEKVLSKETRDFITPLGEDGQLETFIAMNGSKIEDLQKFSMVYEDKIFGKSAIKDFFEDVPIGREWDKVAMLSQKWLGNDLKGDCVLQFKYDGIRVIIEVNSEGVRFLTRNNKPFVNISTILGEDGINAFASAVGHGVYDGEFYIHGAPASVVNGMLTTKKPKADNKIVVKVFDIVDNNEAPERFVDLISRMNKMPALSKFQSVGGDIHRKRIKSQDVKVFLDLAIKEGYEGAMIKRGFYDKDTRSPNSLKAKIFHDATGKYVEVNLDEKGDFLSVSFEGEAEEKKVKANIGSFTEEQKVAFMMGQDLKSPVRVSYKDITEKGSLLFPTHRDFM